MVVVDDADRADTGGGQILDDRRAQTAGTDDQHASLLELLLARAADFGQDQMASVTLDFLG